MQLDLGQELGNLFHGLLQNELIRRYALNPQEINQLSNQFMMHREGMANQIRGNYPGSIPQQQLLDILRRWAESSVGYMRSTMQPGYGPGPNVGWQQTGQQFVNNTSWLGSSPSSPFSSMDRGGNTQPQQPQQNNNSQPQQQPETQQMKEEFVEPQPISNKEDIVKKKAGEMRMRTLRSGNLRYSVARVILQGGYSSVYEALAAIRRSFFHGFKWRNPVVIQAHYNKLDVLDIPRTKTVKLIQDIVANIDAKQPEHPILGNLDLVQDVLAEQPKNIADAFDHLLTKRLERIVCCGWLYSSKTLGTEIDFNSTSDLFEFAEKNTNNEGLKLLQSSPNFFERLNLVANWAINGFIRQMNVCEMDDLDQIRDTINGLNGMMDVENYGPQDLHYLQLKSVTDDKESEKFKTTLKVLKEKMKTKSVIKTPEAVVWTNMVEPSFLNRNMSGELTKAEFENMENHLAYVLSSGSIENNPTVELYMDNSAGEIFKFFVGKTTEGRMVITPIKETT